MKRIIILFFIVLISCQGKKGCKIDPAIIKSNDSIISKLESDSSGRKSWKGYLKRLKEPLLETNNRESYRLIIFNTAGKSSETYRIFKNSHSFKLVHKIFAPGNSGGTKNKLIISQEKKLSKKQWNEFKILIQNTKFWGLPVIINRMGKDGRSWIFEGMNPDGNNCTNRNYHIISRWEPTDKMKIMKLNNELIKLNRK